MSETTFASRDVTRTWPYIRRSVDRIVDHCSAAHEGQLHWQPAHDANSLATLATHAMGNLDHRILGLFCGQRRTRDRDREFESDAVSAEEIVHRWVGLSEELEAALARMPQERVNAPFEHPERGLIDGQELLLIVARHMAEHMGQADLTFELWNEKRG